MGNEDVYDSLKWSEAIVSTLQGGSSDDVRSKTGSLPVKRLRRLVLLTLQIEESNKKAKKNFKRTIQALEKEKRVSISEEGIVTLRKKKKRKAKDEKSKETIKKKRKEAEIETGGDDTDGADLNPQHKDKEEQEKLTEESVTADTVGGDTKNRPCKGNPQGITRLFLGNLPFAVEEASLGAFLPGEVTHIKWITDQATGKFYGSAFCEMDNAVHAAKAVAMAGTQLIGRPVKINYAPARPGDVWPPARKVVSGGGQAGGTGVKAMSAKPENCCKLFIGNLSYDIDDDGISKFFANVDAEVKAVRWLHHKDSGDFKGCGFVEFWNAEACEKAATLNGKNLLGRPIRIDWTD